MSDYGCWPLWLMTDIGLVNINPSKYISDKILLNEINEWSDIDPQTEADYTHEIKGIFYCKRILNNTKYTVYFHSNLLHKKSSNLKELLNELLESVV